MDIVSFYNTKTKTYTKFIDPLIKWYNCGPTVYDSSHLGHARTYIYQDVIRRILEHFGYTVLLAMNITDIDDKIIAKGDQKTISEKYEKEFWDDLDKLGVQSPTYILRVTEHIPEIIEYIQQIMKNGFAYKSDKSSSVYFDIDKYHEVFSDILFESKTEGGFKDTFLDEKRKPHDFALWKASKEDEPWWDSPWGKGRPGWHIECSTLMHKIFEDKTTVHSGGIDLLFPHHENEMKQQVAHTMEMKTPAFFHFGHLTVDGKKMSKSDGNYITIMDALSTQPAHIYRLAFLLHKYSDNMDFTNKSIERAIIAYKTFINFIRMSESLIRKTSVDPDFSKDEHIVNVLFLTKLNVNKYLKTDFDTKNALESLYNLIYETNKYATSDKYNINIIKNIYNFVKETFEIFGIFLNRPSDQGKSKKDVGDIMDVVCEFRDKVRDFGKENKQWKLFDITDWIRDIAIPKCGIIMEDGTKCTIWKEK
jgi:cysteinyl-tRNA synthetase